MTVCNENESIYCLVIHRKKICLPGGVAKINKQSGLRGFNIKLSYSLLNSSKFSACPITIPSFILPTQHACNDKLVINFNGFWDNVLTVSLINFFFVFQILSIVDIKWCSACEICSRVCHYWPKLSLNSIKQQVRDMYYKNEDRLKHNYDKGDDFSFPIGKFTYTAISATHVLRTFLNTSVKRTFYVWNTYILANMRLTPDPIRV